MVFCAICRDTITVPTALKCGHVFCNTCAMDISSRRGITCAVCRTKTEIAIERLFLSEEEAGPDSEENKLPELCAKDVYGNILNCLIHGRITEATQHFKLFTVYTVMRVPDFVNMLSIASSEGTYTSSSNPLISHLYATRDLLGKFASIPDHDSMRLLASVANGQAMPTSQRLDFMCQTNDIIMSYGLGVDIWRNNGCVKTCLDKLDFFEAPSVDTPVAVVSE